MTARTSVADDGEHVDAKGHLDLLLRIDASRLGADRASAAIEIASQFAAAWNRLGAISYQTQRYRDAESNFRRALPRRSNRWSIRAFR
jgi:tetratricopeptide (TPR) repeat protein